jgi:hypothetical protein
MVVQGGSDMPIARAENPSPLRERDEFASPLRAVFTGHDPANARQVLAWFNAGGKGERNCHRTVTLLAKKR